MNSNSKQSSLDDYRGVDYRMLRQIGSASRQRHGYGSRSEEVAYTKFDDVEPFTQTSDLRAAQESRTESLQGAESIHNEKKALRHRAIAQEACQIDFEVQGALLEKENPLCPTLQKIATKLFQAQRSLSEEHSALILADNYNLSVTLRNNINAMIVGKQSIFIEAGVVVLLDYYLKHFTVADGVSEDHIAAILAHEISHADPEAEGDYLNEEYCDVNGIVLTATAGYNPRAMIDIEDFFIWLHEKPLVEEASSKGEPISHAILPSHPNPANRRVVIVNYLEKRESSLPNQTKEYSYIPNQVTSELRERMLLWQNKAESRLLPNSSIEAVTNIQQSHDINELIDAIVGADIFLKASVYKEVCSDEVAMARITLLQAIFVELSVMGIDLEVKLNGEQYSSLSNIFTYYNQGFSPHSFVIGGLANQIVEPHADSEDVQNTMARLNLTGRSIETSVRKEYEVKYSQGDFSTAAARARESNEREVAEIRHKLNDLLNDLMSKVPPLDWKRIIAGDFTEDHEIEALLQSLGIENFDNFIKNLQQSMLSILLSQSIGEVSGERIRSCSVVGELADIENLLAMSLPYRIDPFITASIGSRFHTSVRSLSAMEEEIEKKLEELSKELSANLQEQQLIFELLKKHILKKGDRRYGLPDNVLELELATKNLVVGGSYNTQVQEYQGSSLDQLLQLRLSPSLGGIFLSSILESDSFFNYHSLGNRLAESIDFISLYQGEMELVRNDYGSIFARLENADFDNLIALIRRSRKTLAAKGWTSISVSSLLNYVPLNNLTFSDLTKLLEALDFDINSNDYFNLLFTQDADRVEVGEVSGYIYENIMLGNYKLKDMIEYFRRYESTELGSIDEATYITLSRKYEVMMAVVRRFEILPILLEGATKMMEHLFQVKRILAAYERKDSYADVQNLRAGSYVSTSDPVRSRIELEVAFDFMSEGGHVGIAQSISHFSSLIQWGRMFNSGVSIDIIDYLRDSEITTEELRTIVTTLLEGNASRYTETERDKWISLLVYYDQPGLRFERLSETHTTIDINTDKGTRTIDITSIEDMMLFAEIIERMPTCSYKDECITRLISFAHRYLYITSSGYGSHRYSSHPARATMEKRLFSLVNNHYSPIARGEIQDNSRDLIGRVKNALPYHIPYSEKYKEDPIVHMYSSTLTTSFYQDLIYRNDISSPFSIAYRKSEDLAVLDIEERELQILNDRIEFINQMPDSETKEFIILYTFHSAIENTPGLQGGKLKERLHDLLEYARTSFRSSQALARLLSVDLELELGVSPELLSHETLVRDFETRETFLAYIFKYLPVKSAARDAYIILAIESYPLQLDELQYLRSLLFSLEYRTDDKDIYKQRGALEVLQEIKSNEKVESHDIKDLMLWLIDEDLQIRTVDDFLKKIGTSEKGRNLLFNALPGIVDTQQASGLKAQFLKLGITVFLMLPYRLKKKLFSAIIGATISDRNLGMIIRSGLPAGINTVLDSSLFSSGKVVFNSILDLFQGPESPQKRELLFSMFLGRKGILEGSVRVVSDSDTFSQRLNNNFDGDVMHEFIDSVLAIPFSKSRWNSSERNFVRVAVHSFIERVDPVLRSNIMYELFNGIQKVDFKGDQKYLRSTLLQLMLNCLGIVGAKLGQMDAVIPPDLRVGLSSFKHNTRAVSRFVSAEIMLSEGLSDEYTIIDEVASASTATGLHVQDPNGIDRFVKVLKPEVARDWREYFAGLEYMFLCLKNAKLIKFDPYIVLRQLRSLVEEEMSTAKEIDNVVRYMNVDTSRDLIRPVNMELPSRDLSMRIGPNREPIARPENSQLVFMDYLDTVNWVVLSDLENTRPGDAHYEQVRNIIESVDLMQIYSQIVDDFLYRAFVLGRWHSDLHTGNILINRNSLVTGRINNDSIVYIDFGQTGSVESEDGRASAAQLFLGLAMNDRRMVAHALSSALVGGGSLDVVAIMNQLRSNIFDREVLINSTLAACSSLRLESFLPNFLKACVTVLPCFEKLPRKVQFEKLYEYMDDETRNSTRVKIFQKVA